MSMTTKMKHLCVALAFVMALECCGVLGRLDWVEVVKRPYCRRFDVNVYIDCDKPWFFHRPSNSQFSMLCRYCREGIENYWSRRITYASSTWIVNSKTILRSSGVREKIELQWRKSSSPLHNSDILKMTVKYLSKRSDAAALFKETCAHEIGHSFLRDAHGIEYSWGHKGTSRISGGLKPSTPAYPSSGEIDLMKYYKGSTSNFFKRVVAAESDVQDLVFKVRDSYTTNTDIC